MDGSTPTPQIPVMHEPDLLKVYALFGVGDMGLYATKRGERPRSLAVR
jgi:hypothetical protein